MALIDLKTNLKSLKYGDDRLGGGSSNQPYIQTDINTGQLSTSTSRGLGLLKPVETATNGIINTIGKLNKFVGNVDDGFIRGGAVGAAQAATTDLLRIGKFFTDAPRGPLFIAKQVGLQLSNPRLEVKKGLRGVLSNILSPQGTLATLTGGLLEPTRIYNLGINTLAQVPVNAFGGHFNRHGLLPFQGDDSKYLSVATVNNQGDSNNNRLVGLRKQFNLGDLEPDVKSNLITKLAFLPFKAPIKLIGSILKGKPLNIFKGEDTIDFYIGGPKSIYGIGTTTIRRYDYTENKKIIDDAFDRAFRIASIAKIDWTPSDKRPGPLSENGPSLSYAKAPLNKDTENQNRNAILGLDAISPAAKIYQKQYKRELERAVKAVQNIDQEIAFSNVPNRNFKTKEHGPFQEKTFTTKPNSGLTRRPPIDPESGLPTFKYYGERTNISKDGSQVKYDNTDLFARKDADIMTVAFRVVDPFDNIPPAVFSKELDNSQEAKNAKKRRHYFSAYMTGYKDSFSGNWNEINYAGRAESFYVYDKFKRTVSFNLQIPCNNRKELFEKHRNLGQIAAATAGAYNSQGFLGGVLIQINLGNYLVGEFGILNNLSYSIPNDAAWDVTPEGRLAMYLEASFDFTIIHKDLPEYSVDGGFFKYLPNNLSGFLTTISDPQEWVYDNYVTASSGDTITPAAVILPNLEQIELTRVTGVSLQSNQQFNPYTKLIQTTLTPSQLASNQPIINSSDPFIIRSQQPRAQTRDPLDPIGLNKYFNSIPQPPDPEEIAGETTGPYQYKYNPQDNNNNDE